MGHLPSPVFSQIVSAIFRYPFLLSAQLSAKVATKFSYAKFNVDKGQLTADGGRVLETSLKPHPNVKLSFKANKGADLGCDYTKGPLCATATLDVMSLSKLNASACYGLDSKLKVGFDAAVALKGTCGLSACNVGASYSTGPIFAAVVAAPQASKATLSLAYKVNDQMTIGSQTTHSGDKMCDFHGAGGSFKLASGATVKAKYCGKGLVSTAYVREVVPKVTVTAAASFKPDDMSTFKPGLSITI